MAFDVRPRTVSVDVGPSLWLSTVFVCGSPDVPLALCGSPRLWISEVPSAVSVDLDLRSHRSLWISEAPTIHWLSLSKPKAKAKDKTETKSIKCFDNDKVRYALIEVD